MTKVMRNFWLDLALAILLGLNIVLIALPSPIRTQTHLSLVGHLHALFGILLTLICLVHIALHWQWFRAVLTGRVRSPIKFGMNSLVAVLMIVAVLSGRVAVAFAGGLHGFIGYLVLLGLLVHTIKHMRWMASVAKRLVTGPEPGDARQSA